MSEMTPADLAALRELADDLDSIVQAVSSRDGDATARQHQRAVVVRKAHAVLAALQADSAEPRDTTRPAEPQGTCAGYCQGLRWTTDAKCEVCLPATPAAIPPAPRYVTEYDSAGYPVKVPVATAPMAGLSPAPTMPEIQVGDVLTWVAGGVCTVRDRVEATVLHDDAAIGAIKRNGKVIWRRP